MEDSTTVITEMVRVLCIFIFVLVASLKEAYISKHFFQ